MKKLCRNSAIIAMSVFGLIAPAAYSHAQATRSDSQQKSTVLTFGERVAYQYAIEEVYWRHRIWPKENPGVKRPLDEVMSRADVDRKVEDYLHNAQLLADQRRPITPGELQAEMDRMASHTKQPDVLRELFAALGNDPFVIAECLVRPVLAERLVSARNAVEAFTAASAPTAKYVLLRISVPLDCTDDTWTPTTLTNAPDARDIHTAVWTGSEMIVWGGYNGSFLNTGGKYNPTTDSWTTTSISSAPSGRWFQTAVWTGTEMIVWGGSGIGFFNTGAKYNPATDSWTTTSTANAPDARDRHSTVWTGTEMIIWGGENANLVLLNTGGRYNPNANSWTATTTANAPSARVSPTAVWTGSEMIIWGGRDQNFVLFNTGGRYDSSTDTWLATTTTNAPEGRYAHTAVWSASEMIVWGGIGSMGGAGLSTGGRYNSGTNAWIATATGNAPQSRGAHTAIWTGTEMIIWGGVHNGDSLNTGGRYNLSGDNWRPTNIISAPSPRDGQSAVWTGTEMLVWGGANASNNLNTGGRYCAQPAIPIVQTAVSRKTHGGAGAFDVNLPLSGTPGIECRSDGATNDYTVVVTFLANVSVNGNPQAAVTAGTGTVGSGGVSNGGVVTISGNVVMIPLTNVANAQTINVTLNGMNGSTNIVIPMSILIGDTSANGTVNAADVAQTKSRLGQTVDATNFRSDVNANGSINAGDVSIVKANLGTGLP